MVERRTPVREAGDWILTVVAVLNPGNTQEAVAHSRHD